MDISSMRVFSAATRQMEWLAARQKAVAGNIANINTPRYMPSDLTPLDFAGELGQKASRTTMTRTSAGHMAAPSAADSLKAGRRGRPFETTLDKNGVVLEEQMAKEKDIAQAYQVAAGAYKKHMQMLKKAIQ
ncbi:flagellar basal body rod protein FlgB [Alphaproteobacteria bacterium]|nr:flagellar basal body rod protein FlgB [Alphaproteobacteria bacterium]